jgi:hypothetical protein
VADGVSGDLADREHEIDDAVVRQARLPGLGFRQAADLRQVSRVGEGQHRHAVSAAARCRLAELAHPVRSSDLLAGMTPGLPGAVVGKLS